MAEGKGRKPDYIIKAIYKPTGMKGRVGVAWKNDDNFISVVFDPWVNLTDNFVVTMFPNDGKYNEQTR